MKIVTNYKEFQMSKSFFKAMLATQYEVLLATSNKDRLKYVIAGVKNKILYNLKGDEFGEWDDEDVEFFVKEDLDLARITTSKLKTAQNKMLAYFNKEETTSSSEEEASPSSEEEASPSNDIDDGLPEVDLDEVIAKCKKAIKKGNAKKAKKLLGFIPEDEKAFKKLSKKIKEL